jgi:hypothetical protein
MMDLLEIGITGSVRFHVVKRKKNFKFCRWETKSSLPVDPRIGFLDGVDPCHPLSLDSVLIYSWQRRRKPVKMLLELNVLTSKPAWHLIHPDTARCTDQRPSLALGSLRAKGYADQVVSSSQPPHQAAAAGTAVLFASIFPFFPGDRAFFSRGSLLLTITTPPHSTDSGRAEQGAH